MGRAEAARVKAEMDAEMEYLKQEKARIEQEWPIPKGFDTKCVNFGIMGLSGAGKSSLINKILDKKVAEVGVTQTIFVISCEMSASHQRVPRLTASSLSHAGRNTP